jgi:ferredoxin-NADP reductase
LLDRRLPKEKYTHFFFICGPPPMMDAVQKGLSAHGVPQEHIQSERFNLA